MVFCRVCAETIKPNEPCIKMGASEVHKRCAQCAICHQSNASKLHNKSIYCDKHYNEALARPGIVLLQTRARTFLALKKKTELFKKLAKDKTLYRTAVIIQTIFRGFKARQKWKLMKSRNWRK